MYNALTGLWVQVSPSETKTITEFFVMPRMFHIITIELQEIQPDSKNTEKLLGFVIQKKCDSETSE